jgi:hypothetical protein
MQSEIWTYRPSVVAPDVDLEGFEIEARDGSIGKIDEATNETGSSSVVVDTGPWIFGKKVVLPAGVIERLDLQSRKVFVDLTKDQIKDSPEYDPDRFDEAYRTRLGSYYAGTRSTDM